ncbi:uroporphyrinogen decarboxylase family protein, partial [Acinetobacter baumannii]
LLEKNAKAVVQHLKCQVEAGAQAIMMFDTWGGLLSRAAYQEFSLRYISFTLDSLKNQLGERLVPSIVFTKGGGQWL